MNKSYFLSLFLCNIVVIHSEYGKDEKLSFKDLKYATPLPCNEYCDTITRHKRSGKPIRSQILEVMKKTKTLHVKPPERSILDFISDKYELPREFKGPLAEYDFIVVGAGSAGSVLASRLTEGGKASVLVLEAGRGEPWFSAMPMLAPLFQQTDYVWPYLTEQQPGACMGMTNQRCFWPKGKVVGGSSVVNYMIYTKGFREDWDRIAGDGNYGWSYDEVIPFYKKSERADLRGLEDSPWHGRKGELNVEYVPYRSKLAKAFMDAGRILGNRKVDYNSPDGFGFSYIQATMLRGRRVSSARAFLHDNKKRKNLHILTGSRATRVLIDPVNKTAYGIEFYRNGRMYQIRAKKEVIVTAGPIESPHLLMLSGIGPKEHLESFGIPVVKDLQVGQTLYDHITFPGLAFVLNTSISLNYRKLATIENFLLFDQYGDGPISSLGGVETIGYIKTNNSTEVGAYPDIELLGTCVSFASDGGTVGAKGLHIADWLYKDVYKPVENLDSFTIIPVLLHPKSKGYLKLRSRNPFDDLKIYSNYLTDPQDAATMIAAIRYILKLVETTPYQKFGAKLHKKKFPNCKQYNFGSDPYWECAVRTVTATIHHPIATCRMGPSTDPDAVVDPELRVHGVKNLRVMDSSVIPRTVTAHTNAPAIMIGEKAAEMLLERWMLN